MSLYNTYQIVKGKFEKWKVNVSYKTPRVNRLIGQISCDNVEVDLCQPPQ